MLHILSNDFVSNGISRRPCWPSPSPISWHPFLAHLTSSGDRKRQFLLSPASPFWLEWRRHGHDRVSQDRQAAPVRWVPGHCLIKIVADGDAHGLPLLIREGSMSLRQVEVFAYDARNAALSGRNVSTAWAVTIGLCLLVLEWN